MLALPCHAQVETLEAGPIVQACPHARADRRRSYAGSAAQDVVRSIQAEIAAETKLVTAKSKMDAAIAGVAEASAKT
jgi:hypothetical protein